MFLYHTRISTIINLFDCCKQKSQSYLSRNLYIRIGFSYLVLGISIIVLVLTAMMAQVSIQSLLVPMLFCALELVLLLVFLFWSRILANHMLLMCCVCCKGQRFWLELLAALFKTAYLFVRLYRTRFQVSDRCTSNGADHH